MLVSLKAVERGGLLKLLFVPDLHRVGMDWILVLTP
jgi:hypothetical protein